MMRAYALAAALAAIIGAGGYVWALKTSNEVLRARLEVSKAKVAGCFARIDNMQEDRASDDEIDNLDTDGLRDAASRWLRENP